MHHPALLVQQVVILPREHHPAPPVEPVHTLPQELPPAAGVLQEATLPQELPLAAGALQAHTPYQGLRRVAGALQEPMHQVWATLPVVDVQQELTLPVVPRRAIVARQVRIRRQELRHAASVQLAPTPIQELRPASDVERVPTQTPP